MCVLCFWIGVDLVLVFVGLGLFQTCSHFPFSPHSKDHALHLEPTMRGVNRSKIKRQSYLKKFIQGVLLPNRPLKKLFKISSPIPLQGKAKPKSAQAVQGSPQVQLAKQPFKWTTRNSQEATRTSVVASTVASRARNLWATTIDTDNFKDAIDTDKILRVCLAAVSPGIFKILITVYSSHT